MSCPFFTACNNKRFSSSGAWTPAPNALPFRPPAKHSQLLIRLTRLLLEMTFFLLLLSVSCQWSLTPDSHQAQDHCGNFHPATVPVSGSAVLHVCQGFLRPKIASQCHYKTLRGCKTSVFQVCYRGWCHFLCLNLLSLSTFFWGGGTFDAS